jgi:site-specific DNA-methyltransferase (adenine-specific)
MTTKARQAAGSRMDEQPASHSEDRRSPLEGVNLEGPTLPVAGVDSDPEPVVPGEAVVGGSLEPIFSNHARGVWLYQGNSLAILEAVADKYPEGCFDMIFADPPYFLSNGGITCHAGRMVSVHKGDWDKSRGAEENHNFNRAWLDRCRRVLKPNGTIWVTGTHHVIFSVGFAMQQLGFKILNDIAWEKPNPPPNLSCRYFTHSTETILWAAKSEKSKHVFNYQAMKKVTGKQMKTVWRAGECSVDEEEMPLVWTMSAPGKDEKAEGKHPAQKPVALIERCIAASTAEGGLVLDPFMGAGSTAIACLRQRRQFVGVELDPEHAGLATRRVEAEATRQPGLFAGCR